MQTVKLQSNMKETSFFPKRKDTCWWKNAWMTGLRQKESKSNRNERIQESKKEKMPENISDTINNFITKRKIEFSSDKIIQVDSFKLYNLEAWNISATHYVKYRKMSRYEIDQETRNDLKELEFKEKQKVEMLDFN